MHKTRGLGECWEFHWLSAWTCIVKDELHNLKNMTGTIMDSWPHISGFISVDNAFQKCSYAFNSESLQMSSMYISSHKFKKMYKQYTYYNCNIANFYFNLK